VFSYAISELLMFVYLPTGHNISSRNYREGKQGYVSSRFTKTFYKAGTLDNGSHTVLYKVVLS